MRVSRREVGNSPRCNSKKRPLKYPTVSPSIFLGTVSLSNRRTASGVEPPFWEGTVSDNDVLSQLRIDLNPARRQGWTSTPNWGKRLLNRLAVGPIEGLTLPRPWGSDPNEDLPRKVISLYPRTFWHGMEFFQKTQVFRDFVHDIWMANCRSRPRKSLHCGDGVTDRQSGPYLIAQSAAA